MNTVQLILLTILNLWICQLICNPQINIHSTFMIIHGNVQTGEDFEFPDVHILSWGRTKAVFCLLVSTLLQRWPEDGEGRGQGSIVQALALGTVGQVWTPTLAPVSGMASGKSLNTSEPHFLFCKMKTEYTRGKLFLGFKIIICLTYTHTHLLPLGAMALYSLIHIIGDFITTVNNGKNLHVILIVGC